MTFLNAALLAGVAALAIPIIIHLFHKSRFQVVKWGAMHLLEAVLKTNRRRIQIEQWILLAIRCAIPVLLALAMARPLWKGARSLLGDAKTSTVVLLDNSYSMDAATVGLEHRFEQVHRAPLHDLETALVKEVDEDRNRQRGGSAEEGDVKEVHFFRAPFPYFIGPAGGLTWNLEL